MGVNGIYGLSGSGLDIESMVKVGMMSRQNEYDKMAQKYTQNEWKKAALLELNSQITTFNMSSLSDYTKSYNMKAKTAESSNESAVKVTANASAALMSHRVDVLELSTNAYLIGNKNVSTIIEKNRGTNYTDTSKAYISDILFSSKLEDAGDNSVKRTYDGYTKSSKVEYKFDDDTPKITTTKNNDNSITSATTLGNKAVDIKTTKNGDNYTYVINIGKDESDSEDKQLTVNLTRNDDNTFTLTGYQGTVVINSLTEGSQDRRVINFLDYKLTLDVDKRGSDSIISLNDSEGKKLTFNTIGEINSVNDNKIDSSNDAVTKIETYTAAGKPDITLETKGTTVNFKLGDGEKYESGTLSGDGKTITFGSGSKIDLSDEENPTSFTITNSKSEKAISFKVDDGTNTTEEISFTYAQLLDGKSINDLVTEINTQTSAKGANIKAAYDNISGRFSLYNSKAGDKDLIKINVESNSNAGVLAGKFFTDLELYKSENGVLKDANFGFGNGKKLEAAGSYGKVKIDGVEYNDVTDNRLTVSGITYSFLNTTGDKTVNGTTTNPVTVSISQDTDGIIEKVKSFVESYNKILSSLYEKYDEKPDSNYKPLTQSQKDNMKEDQITKWEEKAKQGLLYHDQTISKIIGQMRDAISTAVAGVKTSYVDENGKVVEYELSAYSIGISTTGQKGQLKLDEDKLKKALADNADSVYKVFANLKGGEKNRDGITEADGIAQRLSDIFNDATKLIKSRAGSSADIAEDSDLNNLLRELQTKMSNFKKLMSAFEDRLYKKYDAMEAALSKLGMQLNFITGAQN